MAWLFARQGCLPCMFGTVVCEAGLFATQVATPASTPPAPARVGATRGGRQKTRRSTRSTDLHARVVHVAPRISAKIPASVEGGVVERLAGAPHHRALDLSCGRRNASSTCRHCAREASRKACAQPCAPLLRPRSSGQEAVQRAEAGEKGKCNMQRMQHATNATCNECNTQPATRMQCEARRSCDGGVGAHTCGMTCWMSRARLVR